ncbi:MAG: DUF4411 family protein [Melioribacteraceae bacterium]
MKIVIDTSSLLSLVRYYFPFDYNKTLHSYFQNKIENQEIIILDKVYDECSYTARGIIKESMPYISKKKYQFNTTELIPSHKFFNQLENQFIRGVIKNKLSSVEYENYKDEYLNSADAKILLFAAKYRSDNIIVVTEETFADNDNKLFKKLPSICGILDIKVMNLPQYLQSFNNLSFNID